MKRNLNTILEVYLSENGKYGKPMIYSDTDNVTAKIFNDELKIDLSGVFKEI